MFNEELYDVITEYANKYKCPRFDIEENKSEYMKLVDKCIEAGTIPKCNRNEYSTHSRLTAAIVYLDNRERFCTI